jgi:MFS family permease
MSNSLPIYRLLAIASFAFAIAMIGNTLEPAVYGHKVLQFAPDQPNSMLGAITFVGLVIAMLSQPIIGRWSDHLHSRWGKRVPFFAIGGILVSLALQTVAWSPSIEILVISVVVLQFGQNMIAAPWQALIPEHVPGHQRGRAAGLRALADILAAIVGRLVAGQLMSRVDMFGAFAIHATVLAPTLAIALAFYITVRYVPNITTYATTHASGFTSLRTIYSVDLKAHPAFLFWFLNRLFYWVAFISLGAFLLFYAIDVLGMTQAHAQQYINTLIAVIGTGILIILIPAGWLADTIGRKPLLILGSLGSAIALAVFLYMRDLTSITICGGLIGMFAGLFISTSWAMITDIVPSTEAARYIGVGNIANAGGSALARLFGGLLVDNINRMTGSHSAGYTVLYGIACVLFVLSFVMILPLKTQKLY